MADEGEFEVHDKQPWWIYLLWPVVIVIFLFNVIWVNVFKRNPIGK